MGGKTHRACFRFLCVAEQQGDFFAQWLAFANEM